MIREMGTSLEDVAGSIRGLRISPTFMTDLVRAPMQTETTEEDKRPERTAEENEAEFAAVLRIKRELENGRPEVPKVTNDVNAIAITQQYEPPQTQLECRVLEARSNIEQPPRKVYKLIATIERHKREAALRKKRLKKFLPLVVIGGISISGIILNGISISNIIYNSKITTISNSGHQDGSTFTYSIPKQVLEGGRVHYAKEGDTLEKLADQYRVAIPGKENPVYSGKPAKADSIIANTHPYSKSQQFANIKSQMPKNNNNINRPRSY